MSEQLDLLGEPREDPNADLVGFEYQGIKVGATAPWNPAYVYVTLPDGGASVRPASLVRARKLAASA